MESQDLTPRCLGSKPHATSHPSLPTGSVTAAHSPCLPEIRALPSPSLFPERYLTVLFSISSQKSLLNILRLQTFSGELTRHSNVKDVRISDRNAAPRAPRTAQDHPGIRGPPSLQSTLVHQPEVSTFITASPHHCHSQCHGTILNELGLWPCAYTSPCILPGILWSLCTE